MVEHFVCVHLSGVTTRYNSSSLSFSFSFAKCHSPTSGTSSLLVCVSVHSYCVDDNLHSVCVCVCIIHTELQPAPLTSAPLSGLTVLLLRDCSILAAVWHHLLLSLQQLDHVISVCSCAWSARQMRWSLCKGGVIWRSWSPCVPGFAPVMDDPVNGCDCRAWWPATGAGAISVCRPLHLPPVMNVKLIMAH